MGNSRLTLIGLYNYDHSIFEQLEIPEGMDKVLLEMEILREAGEFETLYPNFEFLKSMIGFWSRSHKPQWEKLWETTQFEYNPIHNYDRTETHTSLETRDLSSSDRETRNLASTDQETRNLASSDQETRNLASSDSETRDLTKTVDDDLSISKTISEEHTGTTEDEETKNLTITEDNGSKETRALKTLTETDISDVELRALQGSSQETRNLADSLVVDDDTTSSSIGSASETVRGRAFNDSTLIDKEAKSSSNTVTTSGTDDRTEDATHTGTVNIATTDSGTDTHTIENDTEVNETGTVDIDEDRSRRETGTDTHLITDDRTIDTSHTESNDRDVEETESGTISRSGTDTGTVNRTGSDTGTVNRTGSDTGTVNHAGTDTGTISHSETINAFGNIGVLSTQQMIEYERSIDSFNVYDYIVNDFKKAFCVLVY